ncbi:MAG: hypothetical protein ACRCV9_16210 [Burkholderiaceae bacterium]
MLFASTDISGLEAKAGAIVRALPSVTAKALNWTIFNVRDAHRSGMASAFDRPTPFTINRSIGVKLANASKLFAKTEIRSDQSGGIAPINYLAPGVRGGERGQKRMERALQARGLMPQGWRAIPGSGARLDAYGNMSRGQIMQMLSVLQAAEQTSGYSANQTFKSKQRNKKPGDYFASTPTSTGKTANGGRLPYGIYERKSKGKIKVILRFRPTVRYRVRFDYWGIAQRKANEDFPRLMRKAALAAFPK